MIRSAAVPDRRSRSQGALGLALGATGTALALSTLAGWQRGGWMVERIAWVAIGAVLVLGAHLLPALGRASPAKVRWVGGVLWVACMIGAGSGHATFILLSQQHAGDRRAESVTLPGGMPALVATRSSTAIAAERASVIAAQAAADARRCIGDCPTLRANRLALAARREALDVELSEASRQQAAEEQRIEQVGRAMTRRDAVRHDPVTASLATWLGTAPERVEFLVGLLFAAALEGVACFGWYLALLGRGPPMSTVVTTSPAPVTTTARVPVTLPVKAPVTATPSVSDSPASTDVLTQLARDIAAGQLRLTVADIRRHLGCSQARAAGLRRQLVATTQQP